MLSDAQYLDSSPSTDGEEIKKLLNSTLEREKLDGMKHLIALISLGHDASEFFPQAVKNVVADSVELKRLVYMYLVHYAEVRATRAPAPAPAHGWPARPRMPPDPALACTSSRGRRRAGACVSSPRAACAGLCGWQAKQEIALLSINTFQKDLSDANQLIRALALRVMSSIRLPITTQVVMLSVRKCAKDPSAYVRKTAAHAIPKLYSMDTDQEEALTEVIMDLVRDPSILVTGSALHAFQEVCPTRLDLLHGVFRKLCVVVPEMDEWGQVTILSLLTRYATSQFTDPNASRRAAAASSSSSSSSSDDEGSGAVIQLDPDHRLLLRATIPLLQSRNSGVVVAVASLHFHLAPVQELQASGVAKALVRCSRVGREHAYVVLACIQTIAARRPSMFRPHLKDFYVLASDSAWVARSKLEIMAFIASRKNMQALFTEFRQYIQGGDAKLIAATVQAIGRCAVQVGDAEVTLRSLRGLVSLLRSEQPLIVAEAVLALRNLLMGPASATFGSDDANSAVRNAVKTAARLLHHAERPLTDPVARGSVVWMLGEFITWVPQMAPDILRRVAQSFAEESTAVKLQILTLAAKLSCAHSIGMAQAQQDRCRVLAGFVFDLAACDVHSDVRDRGRALRSFVGLDAASERHAAILTVKKPAPAELSSFENATYTLGSLSYLVQHRVSGFEPLPPFADDASDSSLRTPDQQLASFSTDFAAPAEQGSRDRRVAPEVAASMHTSLAQFYDSSSSSSEHEAETGSSSDEFSESESESDSDSSSGSSSSSGSESGESETAV
jgi:AP-3 complex subunit beta